VDIAFSEARSQWLADHARMAPNREKASVDTLPWPDFVAMGGAM
jgi:hypothetical protein